MLKIFSTDPKKKLQKRYERLLVEARDLQRAGKIPEFAAKTKEAESIRDEIDALGDQA